MRTQRYALFGLALVVAVPFIVGCGGSSEEELPQSVGSISGRVIPDRGLDGVTILLDGLQLDERPAGDGSFLVRNVPAGGYTIRFVSDDGNSGAYRVAEVRVGETTDVGDVPLMIGGQIAGIVSVVDAGSDGTIGPPRPVVGARVVAIPIFVIQEADAAVPPPPNRPEPEIVAITDEYGSYLMRGVPRGPYEVRVIVPGLSPGIKRVIVQPMQTAVADFRLHPVFEPGVGTVEGHVYGRPNNATDALIPLKGALVIVFLERPYVPPIDPQTAAEIAAEREYQGGPTDNMPPIQAPHLSTLTDANGRYSLNVPAGYHHMAVIKEPYVPGYDTVGVRDGETVVKDFVLRLGPIIVGGS